MQIVKLMALSCFGYNLHLAVWKNLLDHRIKHFVCEYRLVLAASLIMEEKKHLLEEQQKES